MEKVGTPGIFDYYVKYDPAEDTEEDLLKRIIYSLFLRRLEGKKPTVIFISADSGEGKSFAGLRLMEILADIQGLEYLKYVDQTNIFSPLEYNQKLKDILYNKDLKKVNFICMHEARVVVNAKEWHSVLNQSIGHVNALSRAIKRIAFIIISQFIKDIDINIRNTLNYYITIKRPIGRKAQMRIFKVVKDDYDIEKPTLNKYPVKGILIFPNGKRIVHKPKYFELCMPRKEVRDIFNKRDYEAKTVIIEQKMQELLQSLKKDIKGQGEKIDLMVKWYMKHPEQVPLLGKKYKTKWKAHKDVQKMYDLTDAEFQTFQSKMFDEMQRKEMM